MARMRTTLNLTDQAKVSAYRLIDAELVTDYVRFEEDDQVVSLHLPLDVQRALAGAWLNAIDEAEREAAGG